MTEVVNLFGDEWSLERDRPGWELRDLWVGDWLGAELLGASLYELPPGSKTYPYHSHRAQEELVLVVSGRPTLRTPEGECELKPGEAVLFPLGPEGEHLVRNDTDEPARILMFSSPADVEVCEYPDSGKIGVYAGQLRLMTREADAQLDYWDGEA